MSMKQILAVLAALIGLAFASQAAAEYTTGLESVSLGDIKARAEAGDGNAQLELGHRYYYDKALKDDKKALKWFQKAAEQNVPWAEYETAAMYENGEATPANPVTALQWYQKAAAAGITVANLDIGVIYLGGETGPADPVKAASYLKIAADSGEPRAEYLLGTLYRDGTGVGQDGTQAVALFTDSTRQRFQPAAEALEVMYREGTGVAKDAILSHAWRTMSQYLLTYDQAQAKLPKGATASYYYLMTPKLSADDNKAAWDIYAGFMRDFGFVHDTDDQAVATAHDAIDHASSIQQ